MYAETLIHGETRPDPPQTRKRGRPPGSRDSKPRKRRLDRNSADQLFREANAAMIGEDINLSRVSEALQVDIIDDRTSRAPKRYTKPGWDVCVWTLTLMSMVVNVTALALGDPALYNLAMAMKSAEADLFPTLQPALVIILLMAGTVATEIMLVQALLMSSHAAADSNHPEQRKRRVGLVILAVVLALWSAYLSHRAFGQFYSYQVSRVEAKWESHEDVSAALQAVTAARAEERAAGTRRENPYVAEMKLASSTALDSMQRREIRAEARRQSVRLESLMASWEESETQRVKSEQAHYKSRRAEAEAGLQAARDSVASQRAADLKSLGGSLMWEYLIPIGIELLKLSLMFLGAVYTPQAAAVARKRWGFK